MRVGLSRSIASALAALVFSAFCTGCIELLKREGPTWGEGEEVRKEKEPERAGAEKAPETGTAGEEAGTPPEQGEVETAESPERTSVRSPEEINRYALWCIQRGMWNEARAHLERAAVRDSTHASIYNNLGIVYEYLEMGEKARDAYERAVVLDPTNAVFRRNRDLFRAGGMPGEAKEEGAQESLSGQHTDDRWVDRPMKDLSLPSAVTLPDVR